MKVLLVTKFPPSLGGLETMAVLISRDLCRMPGVEVKVATGVPGPPSSDAGYELIRCPSLMKLASLYRWADVVFHNHCYLRLSIPLLWIRKPYVISMSGILDLPPNPSLPVRIKNRLLRWILAKADANIAACQYVKRQNQVEAFVIPNPYDDSVYCPGDDPARPFDFIFGGRVSQPIKGCLDLVHALKECQEITGRTHSLTIAGDGPDLTAMKELATSLGIGSQLRFAGILKGPDLAAEMRRHRVIVVPSRYQEPIGIICLEGIACGCVAVGSEGGGLGESVGPCGFTYPNGDVHALAKSMAAAVSLSEDQRALFRSRAAGHLSKYQSGHIAGRYLEVLSSVTPGFKDKPQGANS